MGAQEADIKIWIEADPDHSFAGELEERLTTSLRQNTPPNDSEPLTLVARGGSTIVGGLVGATSYGWLLVKVLWVAEQARRRGIGARLIAQGEAVARTRGCHGVWLDTSSRDAERFYRRIGYEPFGVLENLDGESPRGHRRVFLCKRLDLHDDGRVERNLTIGHVSRLT